MIFLGACLAKQGRFSEAKKYHKKSIKVNTQNPDEALFNLGLISRAECNYKEARQYFRKAVTHDPEYKVAQEALNDIEQVLKLKDV